MQPEHLNEWVTLYHAACEDVLPTLGKVDAVITDPPYSERTHKGHDSVTSRTAGDAGYDGASRKGLGYAAWTSKDVASVIPQLCQVASGWVVVMTDHTLAPSIMEVMQQEGRYVFAPLPYYAPGSRCRLSGDGPSSWTDWIIVARTKKQRDWGTLPGGYQPNGDGTWRDKHHMGGKPTGLMKCLVEDYSREGDTILDPFAGSGTTGIAAMLTGRKCILIEKDAKYCEVIRKRVREADAASPGKLFAPQNDTSLFSELANA